MAVMLLAALCIIVVITWFVVRSRRQNPGPSSYSRHYEADEVVVQVYPDGDRSWLDEAILGKPASSSETSELELIRGAERAFLSFRTRRLNRSRVRGAERAFLSCHTSLMNRSRVNRSRVNKSRVNRSRVRGAEQAHPSFRLLHRPSRGRRARSSNLSE